jgi:hypothetical protein
LEASELSARLDLLERLCRRFRARGSSQLLQLAESWSDQLEQYYASIGAAQRHGLVSCVLVFVLVCSSRIASISCSAIH